jgi:dTDP-4-amino-4,6-dideoxygalactose transaminase
MLDRLKEPPPTAGLPINWADFFPTSSTLEGGLSQMIGVPWVQVECSGTAALIIALLTLKQMSHRQCVVITAYTCPWVLVAVVRCGLKPVLCDTAANHFELDINALNQVCNKDTLAIVPTHLAGRVADIKPVLDVAKQCGAYVVEDAAQSLGATLHGQPVGTFGDVGFYSLGVGKGLTIFAGGVLVARDPLMRQALKETSQQVTSNNWLHELKRVFELVGYASLYRPHTLAMVFGVPLRKALKQGDLLEAVGDYCSLKFPLHRVSGWRKRVGANALIRLQSHFMLTREQAMHRVVRLKQIEGVQVIVDRADFQGVWPFIMVLLPSASLRNQVLTEIWSQRLGVGRLFIHALGDYDYLSSYVISPSTPNAQDFAARSMIVSNSLWLKDAEFERVCETISAYCQKNRKLNKD